MKLAVGLSLWVGLFLLLVPAGSAVITSNSTSDKLPPTGTSYKPGKCPSRLLNKDMCPDDVEDQCNEDKDCYGSGKCCSTGCAKVCIQPINTGCDLSRANALRRGRALGLSIDDLTLPECNPDGAFAPIQCNEERCFCVDTNTGFELPGTRARSLEFVNCSEPRPCSGYQCRMLCPFDFELDQEGCPLCQCRDPCREVSCPKGNTCIMEATPCDSELCPPLPTCKQPRSLATLCPFGAPLMLDEKAQKPLLCGTDPGKPTCPGLYKCQVTRGAEYGVCCADVDELIKPGTCPSDVRARGGFDGRAEDKDLAPEDTEVRCGANCDHDLQCPSTQKCCISRLCGQHCVQPTNLTACLEQRMIAELLIVSERAGKGYVPQCQESTGLFLPRQCSRNGLVCWCVHPEGRKRPRTMGAAHEVRCEDETAVEGSGECPSDDKCSTICEYGYSLDDDGCTTCDCEKPCNQLACPDGSECIMREDPSCSETTSCLGVPMCVTNVSSLFSPNDTTFGVDDLVPSPSSDVPLVDTGSACPEGTQPTMDGDTMRTCNPNNPCPQGYTCTSTTRPDVQPVCCTDHHNEIENSTKLGQCPYIPYGNKVLCSLENRCHDDFECSANQKCCVVPDCGLPVCVEPVQRQNSSVDSIMLQGPTMCEYLKDLVHLEGVSLALPVPDCDKNGAYEPIQCNALGQCWCVDDFGTPVPGTKASNRDLVDCSRLQTVSCADVACRLGCDYGFVLDRETICPLCQCRNPCDNIDCGAAHHCQMVEVPCIDGVCPPIPQCVPSTQQRSLSRQCPEGMPHAIPEGNATLPCSLKAQAMQCPRGYFCYEDEDSVDGICCLAPEISEKSGQCPYLMPAASGSCDLECSEDTHCPEDTKCCSNGCGTSCVRPISLTACEHQKTLLEYRAREAGIASERVFLPECDPEGAFVPTQCHPGTLTCWCVDLQGIEVAGTRVSSPAKPNCQKPLVCPAMNCNLACLHGYQLDSLGCPMCACRDPCEEVTCSSTSEECRIVHVACVGEPCPPLPVCLPKLENPCPTGTPLTINGSMIECGPQGQSCASSHKCHLSPLGEYALCCPKPREVCYHDRDSGLCEGSIQRWYFSPDENVCKRFRYGGCGGNLNNFESQKECENACPRMTSCQKIRHKNLNQMEKDKKVTFLPKCDRSTGAWLPEQCLDELGVCWCVSPTGEQEPGTLTRGAPTCQLNSRTARLLDFPTDSSKSTNMVCEPGQTVHVCDKTLCENKVCLSHPGAVCRVNPCDGCSFQFVDSFNAPVNCEVGLTDCQKQLQKVLNSPAFERPNRILTDDLPLMNQLPSDAPYAADTLLEQNLESDQERYKRNTERKDTIEETSRREGRQFKYPVEVKGEGNDIVPSDAPRFYRKSVSEPSYFPKSSFKPGTCPPLLSSISSLQCSPTRDCAVDLDCPGDSKCCFTGCGTICLQPAEAPTSLGMTFQAPQCHSDGSWVREQRSGDLTWCVDSKGRPLHETLTRGHVKCGSSGQILEQMSVGYVCPKGVRSMVCTDECEHAVCPTHPDAVCVADPCNQCKVSFYSSTGEKVSCDYKCSQPLATGMCRAVFDRFFFNSSANQCQEFIYGGCQGNDNNFPSIEACQRECGEKAMTCDQPVKVGYCSDGEARWYFNKNRRKCELFLYSGCGGNDNNFATKDTCENTCPDMILCPYWSAATMEPNPCSRAAACRNQTCHGYPDTICKVDPCTCTAHFYNQDGDRVTCMMATESPKTRLSFTYEEESSSDRFPESRKLADKKGPVTIFLEGEPSLTRCELLQRHLRQTNSQRYIAQCDESGRFVPTQCYSTPFVESFIPEELDGEVKDLRRIKAPNCWCVDEIGRKTEPTVYFKKGERECDVVSVESVVVTLGFRGRQTQMERLEVNDKKKIRNQVHILLRQLKAETLEDEVKIVPLPDVTQVKFTLLGNNKVDVAYQLENQVRRGGLALRLDNEVIPADLRASWFHHQVSEPRWTPGVRFASLSRNPGISRPEPREVVSEAVVMDPPYLATTVVFTVLSAILVCALVVSVVLYRRHVTGQYPKAPRGSLQSLAFSDTSLDRRSISSRLSDSQSNRRYSNGPTLIPHPIRGPHNITIVEEEYRASVH